MKLRGSHSLLIFIVLLLGAALPMAAQEATIVGTVSDQSGAIIPNVNITLTNTESGQSWTAVSNEAGLYISPSVRIGTYTMRAEAAGFKTWTSTGIVLRVGDRARVDVQMQIGETKDSITVESETVRIQSDTSEVSDVITGSQVTSLATNGRNLIALAALVPGASSQNAANAFNTPTPVGSNFNVSFNGTNPDHNVWLADGGENYDRGSGGKSSVMPSIESLAEFRTLTSNYSAEYGLGSGGTMTMVTKAGTSAFHGTLWEFVRNDHFDANDFFLNQGGKPKPTMRFNVFGFNVGGPVSLFGYNKEKNKTFFFYNMEWRKVRQAAAVNALDPSDAWRGGDLGSLLQGSSPIQLMVPSNLSAAQVARLGQFGLTPGQPIQGNRIPSQLIDPNAKVFLDGGFLPKANFVDAAGNSRYNAPTSVPIDLREELVRVDHRFNDKFSVFGHFIAEQVSQGFATPTWSGATFPTVGSMFNNPGYSAVVRAAYAFSPTIINEVAWNYSGNRITISPTGTYQKPSAWKVPEFYTENPLNRMPQMTWQKELGGITWNAWNQPWANLADEHQWRDDLSMVRGRHEFKLGGSFLFYKKRQELFGNSQGAFTFNGQFTGSSFADFLLGYAGQYTELALQDFGLWHNKNYSFYVSDNWRATNRLTFNLGLRWDGMPHVYEVNNRMSNFYPNRYDIAKMPRYLADGTMDPTGPGFATSAGTALSSTPFYLNGIGIAGKDGIPNGLTKDYWNNWAPRVGLAYDITGKGKTVIRAGYGRFYERVQGNDVYNIAANPPFSYQPQVSNVLLSNPSTLATGTGATASAPFKPGSITGLSYDNYKAPTSNQWSIGVQHELFSRAVLSLAYIGNVNVHQNVYREINTPGLNDTAGRQGVVSQSISDVNTIRPYQGFGTVRLSENSTNGHYNGFQTNLRVQAAKGLNLQFAYTLSRAINGAPGGIGGLDLANATNPFDLSYDYGLSQYDRTHIANINYVYELPFFNHASSRATRALLGGWEISGITQFMSGLAITPAYDNTNLGLGGNTGNRPNVTGTVAYPRTIAAWVNPAAFSPPGALQFGNAKKGCVRGPGINNWNLSLFKSFRGVPWPTNKEGANVQFRFEAFNAFNHAQWANPALNYSSLSSFGQITATTGPRTLQLGLRMEF